MANQFYITPQKEYKDLHTLISKIEKDNWVDSSTVIVVCSPEYSSGHCQIINHKLSHRNNNVPFDMDFLEMPYPGQEQYSEYQYIDDTEEFGKKYVNTHRKLLFIDSGVLRGRNFTTLDNIMEEFIGPNERRYACLYKQSDSIFEPDYFVEEFNFSNQGGLTFWWENDDNPYWGW